MKKYKDYKPTGEKFSFSTKIITILYVNQEIKLIEKIERFRRTWEKILHKGMACTF